MLKIVCSLCEKVHDHAADGKCPIHPDQPEVYCDFSNSDEYLNREVKRIKIEHQESGLKGLVGGLQAVIINTEAHNLKAAAQEFLARTGYDFSDAFEDDEYANCILKLSGSADVILRSRKSGDNPFKKYNLKPKSKHLPNTRLETFVFHTNAMDKYFKIQTSRKISFLQDSPLQYKNYRFIQSKPSKYTGVSYGVLQWTGETGDYRSENSQSLSWKLQKPKTDYLSNIGLLDHTATRVRAEEREAAIIEFMEYSNYQFEFSIYVKMFNSITNVARLSARDFAMVFTSGIVPFRNLEESGPTEKFIYQYGPRTHHMAFKTNNIETTYEKLKEAGQEYLVELVGSPSEGLKQTFTVASPYTLLVNEYIHRYGDFDGFFTKQNVTLLTKSTEKQ